LENMDVYRDEGMGDVIFGKPFLREVGIKAKRFEGIITLYKSNDEEYVAVKEDEYNDLTMTRRDACQAYQEIFRIIDEGWMVTRAT
ncbi:hypothetical protein Tco_1550432, partial [Tanacetum coccineum]